MGQVVVTIAGRAFRLACEDGDEARLSDLARTFDATVVELRGSFGEVGDTRLAVMAGLVMTDRLADLQGQMEQLRGECESLREKAALAQSDNLGSHEALKLRLEGLAARLEKIGGQG